MSILEISEAEANTYRAKWCCEEGERVNNIRKEITRISNISDLSEMYIEDWSHKYKKELFQLMAWFSKTKIPRFSSSINIYKKGMQYIRDWAVNNPEVEITLYYCSKYQSTMKELFAEIKNHKIMNLKTLR